jgi:hypothetical protein
MFQLLARHNPPAEFQQLVYRQLRVRLIVDEHSRRAVALSEAGAALDLDGGVVAHEVDHFLQELRRAGDVTGRVGADMNRRLGRRGQPIVRIKARHAVQLVHGLIDPPRKLVQLGLGNPAEALLNGVELGDDHRLPC